jgi:hypothetical protein
LALSVVSMTIAPWAPPSPKAKPSAAPPPSSPCSSIEERAPVEPSEVRKTPACGPSQGAMSREKLSRAEPGVCSAPSSRR